MLKLLRVAQLCASAKPSPGFMAIRNLQQQKAVEQHAAPKLDALVDVVMSLTSRENQYLNQLMTKQCVQNGGSVLSNQLINRHGYKIEPIQYFYQQTWIKNQWKETELLQFILSDEIEEVGDKEEVEVLKDNYDVELTSVDAAQKIKIIKSLREIFSLGLKEAKDFADKVPSMLKKNMKREEAEKLKKDLQAVGCVITLK